MSLKGSLFTEAEFNFVKTLITNGLNHKQAAALKLNERSSATWAKVKRMKDFAEYKAANDLHEQLEREKRQGKTVQVPNGKTVIGMNDNEILQQDIKRLQVSVDQLISKLESLGTNEKTLAEKIFGTLR